MNDSIERLAARRAVSFIAACALATIALGGCGGGGNGSDPASGGEAASTGQPASEGSGTVEVTVKHAFGDPVAGAEVSVGYQYGGEDRFSFEGTGVTDEHGHVRLIGIPPGDLYVTAHASQSGIALHQFDSGGQRLQNGQSIAFELVLGAAAHTPSVGVTQTRVSNVRTTVSGESLDLTVQVVPEIDYYGDGELQVLFEDCEPNLDNDVPAPTPDCIGGPGASDASYTAERAGAPSADRYLPSRAATPYSVILLVDLSRQGALGDPDNSRLYALRYFLARRSPDAHVALAAFAADDAATGEHRELPDEPLSLLATPFATPDEDLHTAIKTLDGLQGGAAPLYDALAAAMDVFAAAPAGESHTIVVLTDGRDDRCAERLQCAMARHRLVEAAAWANVRIVAIGSLTPAGDPRGLDELTRDTGGFTLWAEQPSQTALLLEKAGQYLDGSAPRRELDFRITTSQAGVFQQNRVVLGRLHAQFVSGYGDADPTTVPLRVAIP